MVEIRHYTRTIAAMRVSDNSDVLDTCSLLDQSCEMSFVDHVDLDGGLASSSLVVLISRRVRQVPADRHDKHQRPYTHYRRPYQRPSRPAECVRHEECRSTDQHRHAGYRELHRRPSRLRRRQRRGRRAAR